MSGSEVAHGEAYKEFVAGEEAKKISSGKGTWSGYHHFLDEKGITKEDDYAIAYTRTLAKGNGYLFFDIKAEILQNILENITTKKGIIAAVVTEDGREILQDGKNPEEAVFFGKDYFEKAAAGGEAGSTYISYQGDKYLYSYVPIGTTGLMLCVLTPKSVLLESANSIGITTIIMVIAASIIAMLIGSIMARNIGREVKNLSGSLGHVSEGDFTTEFQSKRKDEFLILARGMTAMLEKLRNVFMTIRDFAGKVDASSSDVSKASEHMLGSMKKIRLAMEDVTGGADRQLSDVRDGMEKMSAFSDRLNDAFAYTREIEESSVKTMEVVSNGRKLADQLNARTEETVVMTNRLTEHIAEVAENSQDIESIVGTIQAIAEQTDLLSLNASIEAARSGKAGRGFGVVAGEIRTLAEQSAQAGNKIQQIVDKIRAKTEETVTCAGYAEQYLKEQTESIGQTVALFAEIANQVEMMAERIGEITTNMSDMMQDKETVLSSIGRIMEVSEETAETTEHVNDTVNGQLFEVEQLAEEAEQLSEEVQRLRELMEQFVL